MDLKETDDLLQSVYNKYLISDTQSKDDNLNPKREINFFDSEEERFSLASITATSAIVDKYNQIVEREPADFDDVIQEVLEEIGVQGGSRSPMDAIIAANKLGLDSLDENILKLASNAKGTAVSAIDSISADIAREILKCVLYLNAEKLIEDAKNKKKEKKDSGPPPTGTERTPTSIYGDHGPRFDLDDTEFFRVTIPDPDREIPTPDGYDYDPTIKSWVYVGVGPIPGPIPGPLKIEIEIFGPGPGPSSDTIPSGDETPPGGDTNPPGGDTNPPGGDTNPPGGDTNPPGGDGTDRDPPVPPFPDGTPPVRKFGPKTYEVPDGEILGIDPDPKPKDDDTDDGDDDKSNSSSGGPGPGPDIDPNPDPNPGPGPDSGPDTEPENEIPPEPEYPPPEEDTSEGPEPGPSQEEEPEENADFENFFSISCDGTIRFAVPELGDGSSRYEAISVNTTSSSSLSNNDTLPEDGGGNNNEDEDDYGLENPFYDSNGNCVTYELTILKILMAVVDTVKIVSSMIDPVGVIISELAKVLTLAGQCWRNPPAANEMINFLAGKVKAVLIKILGWSVNYLFRLVPSLFCTIEGATDIIEQLKQCLYQLNSLSNEINNVGVSLSGAIESTKNSVDSIVGEALDLANNILEGINPDRLTEGAKDFSEFLGTTANAFKGNGLLPSSSNPGLKGVCDSTIGLMNSAVKESNSIEAQKAWEDVLQARNEVSKAIKDISSAKTVGDTALGKQIKAIGGAFSTFGKNIADASVNNWSDWGVVSEKAADTLGSAKDVGESFKNGADPLLKGLKATVNLSSKLTDETVTVTDRGGTHEQQLYLSQTQGWQNKLRETKKSDKYKNAATKDKIGILTSAANEYSGDYQKRTSLKN